MQEFKSNLFYLFLRLGPGFDVCKKAKFIRSKIALCLTKFSKCCCSNTFCSRFLYKVKKVVKVWNESMPKLPRKAYCRVCLLAVCHECAIFSCQNVCREFKFDIHSQVSVFWPGAWFYPLRLALHMKQSGFS